LPPPVYISEPEIVREVWETVAYEYWNRPLRYGDKTYVLSFNEDRFAAKVLIICVASAAGMWFLGRCGMVFSGAQSVSDGPEPCIFSKPWLYKLLNMFRSAIIEPESPGSCIILPIAGTTT
jgi:hypothetical protein